MPVYTDLKPLDCFGDEGTSWRAVGWLGAGEPFRGGEVSRAFIARLGRLLRGRGSRIRRSTTAPWSSLAGPDSAPRQRDQTFKGRR